MKLLALSGSLRRHSYNTSTLRALAALTPPGVELTLGDINLPLFNPDLEETPIPALNKLREQIARASGLVIASPEYAHGISGPMKNALDWLASGVEFPNKPVMLINTSPRAHHALDSMREVLSTMSARIVDEAFVSVPLLGTGLDEKGLLQDEAISNSLGRALDRFCTIINEACTSDTETNFQLSAGR